MPVLRRLLLQCALVGGALTLGGPAGATPYYVSLVLDAAAGAVQAPSVFYSALPTTSVSDSNQAVQLPAIFPGNIDSSSSSSDTGTAALGQLLAMATGTGDGLGYGTFSASGEVSFQDTLTISPVAPAGPLAFEVMVTFGDGSVSATCGDGEADGTCPTAGSIAFMESNVFAGTANLQEDSLRPADRRHPAGQWRAANLHVQYRGLYGIHRACRRHALSLAHATNQMAVTRGDFEKGDAGGAYESLKVIAALAGAWPALAA